MGSKEGSNSGAFNVTPFLPAAAAATTISKMGWRLQITTQHRIRIHFTTHCEHRVHNWKIG